MATRQQTKVDRNALCPCGSGKKFKKCCLNKKKRSIAFHFKPQTSASRIRLKVSGSGGIEIEGDQGLLPVDVFSQQIGYRRAKGLKILNQIPTENRFQFLNPDLELASYEQFWVVDTNTRQIAGLETSVCCVMAGNCQVIPSEEEIELTFLPIEYYEFHPMKYPPELIGCAFLIRGLVGDPNYRPNSRYGIVVDAHLQDVERINKRQIPLLGTNYLPANCRLIYASADAGKEYGVNRLMATCDKEASKFLKWLDNIYLRVPQDHRASGPFFRLWTARPLSEGERWNPSSGIQVDAGKMIDPVVLG